MGFWGLGGAVGAPAGQLDWVTLNGLFQFKRFCDFTQPPKMPMVLNERNSVIFSLAACPETATSNNLYDEVTYLAGNPFSVCQAEDTWWTILTKHFLKASKISIAATLSACPITRGFQQEAYHMQIFVLWEHLASASSLLSCLSCPACTYPKASLEYLIKLWVVSRAFGQSKGYMMPSMALQTFGCCR